MLMAAVLVVTVVALVLIYSHWRHRYWKRRGVPVPPGSVPVLGHTLKSLLDLKKPLWESTDKIYKDHGGSTFCGMYGMLTPMILVGDPDLVKHITIKDFDHFVDRPTLELRGKSDELFNDMLTNATGAHWKGIRSVLSPSFTSGRMKGMFPLVAQKADNMVQFLHKRIQSNSAVELRKHFGNYTLEVISSCAFGMEANCLEDENSEFVLKVTELSRVTPWRIIKTITFVLFENIFKLLKINIIPKEMLFFRDVVLESLKQRKAGLNRGDFLDLMIQAQEEHADPTSKGPKYPLTDNTIVAQSVLFIIAGFDTTANTLSFIAYYLAKYPEIQQRLRQEMEDIIKENGELTYYSLMEAKYLDAVISEALRMNGPLPVTTRKCTKDYMIPGTDVIIQKDIIVNIPIYSIHHDERFWPEPNEFQPERFMPENKENIKSGTYMPFGIGPRNCIGMRFAQMEMKLVIAKIILKFNMSCNPGQEEMQFSKVPGAMRPADDFSIIFTPISKN